MGGSRLKDNVRAYSAHGWHDLGPGLRVYHQGGLDSYCGLYALFNLINFLKFSKERSTIDFVGAKEFAPFKELISKPDFQRFIPATPFGGEGLEPPTLLVLLCHDDPR